MLRKPVSTSLGQLGFSTIEVLIASAVAFTLLIGIASMMTNVHKQTSGGQARIETQVALNNLMAALSNGSSCSTALNTNWNQGVPTSAEPTPAGVNPINTGVQVVQIKDPLGGTNILKGGNRLPGSNDLQITKLEVTVQTASPVAKWTRRQSLVQPPPPAPVAYEWCWMANVQYKLDILLTNNAVVAKQAMGAEEEDKSFLLTATQVRGCLSEGPPGNATATPPGPAPTGADNLGWQFASCGIGAGGGYMVTGINDCTWCPRPDPSDANNDACLAFAAPTLGASVDPIDLELRELRFLRSLGLAVSSARANVPPPDDGGMGGGGPLPPPVNQYYTWGPGFPSQPPPVPAPAFGTTAFRTPVGCGIGYYPAGIQMRMAAGGVPTGGGSSNYCPGKYNSCVVNPAPPPSEVQYAVLCCKVGIQ